jgi:hypothetical protein
MLKMVIGFSVEALIVLLALFIAEKYLFTSDDVKLIWVMLYGYFTLHAATQANEELVKALGK